MSTPASQLMLRHTRFFTRKSAFRHASTTSEAAQAASNTAAKSREAVSNITSKASEGLTRVKSSAGPALSGAAQSVNKTLSSIGGRTGRLIAFGRSLVPPTIYYSKVGFELTKLVFRGQKMNPPTLEAFRPYLNSVFHLFRNPGSLLSTAENATNSITVGSLLSPIRNLTRPQLISAGVISAEVLGFFTIGEMIGKMKIVGYRGEVEHGEHH